MAQFKISTEQRFILEMYEWLDANCGESGWSLLDLNPDGFRDTVERNIVYLQSLATRPNAAANYRKRSFEIYLKQEKAALFKLTFATQFTTITLDTP